MGILMLTTKFFFQFYQCANKTKPAARLYPLEAVCVGQLRQNLAHLDPAAVPVRSYGHMDKKSIGVQILAPNQLQQYRITLNLEPTRMNARIF